MIQTLGYLIFNGTLTCIALLLNGLIIMNENVFKYKTLQKCLFNYISNNCCMYISTKINI